MSDLTGVSYFDTNRGGWTSRWIWFDLDRQSFRKDQQEDLARPSKDPESRHQVPIEPQKFHVGWIIGWASPANEEDETRKQQGMIIINWSEHDPSGLSRGC